MLEQATALLSEAGDYRYLQNAYNNAADMALKEGRDEEALRLFELCPETS